MPRIQLQFPEEARFSATIPIRITDLNYGAHVGNDTILTLIHEARVQYLHHHGFEELNVAGAGLIMSDAAIEFKTQLFYGSVLKVYVAATDFARVSFDLYYKLTTEASGKETVIALAKTGMVCFDYAAKKVVAVPEAAVKKLRHR